MDCRAVLLFCLAILLAVLLVRTEAWERERTSSEKVKKKLERTKKVVIHVPYKVKKVKHTHTVFKTIHHHHNHHDHLSPSPGGLAEDHEHFHHMHLHEEPAAHSIPLPGIGIPEFLPDVPLDVPMELPDIPRDIPKPHRIPIPLYRRDLI